MRLNLLLETTLWLHFGAAKARAGGEGARRHQPWMGGSGRAIADKVIPNKKLNLQNLKFCLMNIFMTPMS